MGPGATFPPARPRQVSAPTQCSVRGGFRAAPSEDDVPKVGQHVVGWIEIDPSGLGEPFRCPQCR
jgi:hypothetical protein